MVEGVGCGLIYSEEQATGLERFELLGDLHGVDVFDMKPIEMTRMGTLDEPIPIFTLVRIKLPHHTSRFRASGAVTPLDDSPSSPANGSVVDQ